MPDGQILRFSPKLVFARNYSRLASVLDADGDDVGQAWAPLGNSTPLRVIYRARGGTQGATLAPRGYRANGLVGSTTVGANAIFYPGDPFGGQLLLATEDNTTLDAPLVTDATGWELRLKDGRVFLFDEKGRLEQMTDTVGNTLAIVRNRAGQVQRVSHSSGQQIDLSKTRRACYRHRGPPQPKLHCRLFAPPLASRPFQRRVADLAPVAAEQEITVTKC